MNAGRESSTHEAQLRSRELAPAASKGVHGTLPLDLIEALNIESSALFVVPGRDGGIQL